MRINLSKVYELFQNTFYGVHDTLVTGVSIDTRTIKENDLFFAIKGDNFDGHDFITTALSCKAAAIVCSRKIEEGNINNSNIIYVKDTVDALHRFATFYRNSFDIPFVAVTGSNGKTTTKDFLNVAISTKYKTCYTKGNLNNQTGVPLTIFTLDETTQAAIIEMGMNNIGEINQLSSIVRPMIGVITNIGTSHIGRLGSIDNIFEAKTELIKHIDNGYLVVNADDKLLNTLKSSSNFSIIKTGIYSENLDYTAKDLLLHADNTYSFTFQGLGVRLSIPGIHNVYNALLALAVADLLAVDLKKAINSIGSYKNQNMRTQVIDKNGFIIINDAYNANYDSMKASLEVLSKYKNRKVAILGDMLELGEYEKRLHEKTGEYVALKKIDLLIAIGKNVHNYCNGAMKAGMAKEDIYMFEDINQAKTEICSIISKGDTILLKGSRGSAMEKIMDIFEGNNL